jgi:membrane associated rhomboid family serine protease
MVRLTPVNKALILVNLAVFGLQYFLGGRLEYWLALWPPQAQQYGYPSFHVWQLLTYGFLHSTQNFAHIFFNMFALFMFGRALEDVWGARRFLVYYFASVLAAGVTQLAVTTMTDTAYRTEGASGGVFGVLLAFAIYFPRQRIVLLIPPIPMPAWVFVTLYGIAELVMGVLGTQEGVAHFAHLGGMLGGALVLLYWQATGKVRRP